MAGTSLLVLIDDISTILDDVALMTKVAAKKTAGVLGDDLALNANQVTGLPANRELPVVLAVAKGSAMNKAILVPAAMALSAFAPWAVQPVLMIGGAYLCFEGCEKLAHKWLHSHAEEEAHRQELQAAIVDPNVDLVALERSKIVGAIRTDFVLSAEIIVITLGTVASAAIAKQFAVLCGVSVIMTIGVYGLVALIVKLDDAGLYLSRATGDHASARFRRGLGRLILVSAPYLMKTLSVVGTIAMFVVGGGIIAHGLPPLHDAIHFVAHHTVEVPAVGGLLQSGTTLLLETIAGVLAGAIVLVVLTVVGKLWARIKGPASSAAKPPKH